MKHLKYLLVLGIITSFTFLDAQNVEIYPSYGYQFGAKLNYSRNYIQYEDSDEYGITLGMEVDDNLMGELIYLHQGSQLNIRDVVLSPQKSKLADVNTDWIMLGAKRYFKTGNVKPFAGGGLGLVIISPKNENLNVISRSLDNRTKFTFSFKAGVNFMLSESIGLNFQGNLYLPIDWGGFYIVGNSGGASGGVSVSSTMVLGGVSGGLVFNIGD